MKSKSSVFIKDQAAVWNWLQFLKGLQEIVLVSGEINLIWVPFSLGTYVYLESRHIGHSFTHIYEPFG